MSEAELWARIRVELAWPRRLLKAAAVLAALGLVLEAGELLLRWPG